MILLVLILVLVLLRPGRTKIKIEIPPPPKPEEAGSHELLAFSALIIAPIEWPTAAASP